jgi:hypothetical protein
VGSGDEELRVGQSGGWFGLSGALDPSDFFALGKLTERRREDGSTKTGLRFRFVIYIGCDPLDCPRMESLLVGEGFQQISGLFLVLLQVGMSRKGSSLHTNLLSFIAWSPQ